MCVRQLIIIAFATGVTGCGLMRNALHNFHNEPSQCYNDTELNHRTRAMGKDAWIDYQNSHSECATSNHFKEGFVDGFSDYLDNGGDGSPLAVPPLKYRRNKYLNAEGQLLVAEYMHGFDAGTQAARASGIRDKLVVQVRHLTPATAPSLPKSELPAPTEVTPVAPQVKVTAPPPRLLPNPPSPQLSLTSGVAGSVAPPATAIAGQVSSPRLMTQPPPARRDIAIDPSQIMTASRRLPVSPLPAPFAPSGSKDAGIAPQVKEMPRPLPASPRPSPLPIRREVMPLQPEVASPNEQYFRSEAFPGVELKVTRFPDGIPEMPARAPTDELLPSEAFPRAQVTVTRFPNGISDQPKAVPADEHVPVQVKVTRFPNGTPEP